MTPELYYVTSNVGKYEMVKEYCSNKSNIKIQHVDIDMIEEQHMELRHIALSKAQQAWDAVQKPVLVDDAGIYFDRYNQFPGAMSKFVYQSLGFAGLYRLYDEGDTAQFATYLAYHNGEHALVFEGVVSGTLIKPQGLSAAQNLPYLHLLVPTGQTESLYSLMYTHGNLSFNPRIKALQQFLAYYQNSSTIEAQ